MSPSKIMIIRHGEKPSKDRTIQGVDPTGAADPESLSVRGWQRAGALVHFFMDAGPGSKPTALFAAASRSADSSKRAMQTLSPLAEVLGETVQQDFAVGEEIQLAAKVLQTQGVILIAWEHKAIHVIGNAIVGNDQTVPQEWSGERFDIIWQFTPNESGWSFLSSGQHLLSGDQEA